MKILNARGEALEIRVTGYHLPDSVGDLYDSDWLDARLIIDGKSGHFEQDLGLLILEELDRMVAWLSLVQAGEPVPETLEFVDANMELVLVNSGDPSAIQLRYQPEDGEQAIWETDTQPGTIAGLIEAVQGILAAYPCRCGQVHDVNLNSEGG